MKRLSVIFFCLFAMLSAFAADVRVSLVTCYPGSEVYELDGHTALRLRDDNFDIALNWGIFDFDSPNFLYRFVKGETDYMVAEMPFDYFLESYRRQGRKVVEQPLEADSAAVQRLLEMVSANLQPWNRVYRYNYVKDNCATRPMRLIEASGAGQFSREYVGPERTFRQVMRSWHSAYPWYQFGIDLALGSGIDKEITPEEQAFSPMLLMRMLPVEPQVLTDGADSGSAKSPTPWLLTPMAVFLLVMVGADSAAIWSFTTKRVPRWVYSVFFGAVGLAGCVLTFLIFVSVHEATSPNWLYFFFNPLGLLIAIFIWVKRCRKLVVWCQIVNFALVIAGSVLWPFLGQSMNPAVIPIIVADILLSATYLYVEYKNSHAHA